MEIIKENKKCFEQIACNPDDRCKQSRPGSSPSAGEKLSINSAAYEKSWYKFGVPE